MPKAIVEKATCEKCGEDVRENTVFCYNCGGRVADDPVSETAAPKSNSPKIDPETKAALDDLAEKFKVEEPDDGKLAKAAAERRKARVRDRKPREFVWEQKDESSSRIVVLLALLVTVIAAAVVFLTVFWK